MNHSRDSVGDSELSRPSEFWKHLGRDHALQLERDGFEKIKQRQALRYFNWQWRLRTATKSEQLRFLLSHTSGASWWRAAWPSTAVFDDAWLSKDWSIADRWFYSFAIRLLWQYAAKHGDQDVLALAEPELGGPFPVRFRGRLISQDLANSSLEVSAIRRALRTVRPLSILEVGAGYGRTAHALLKLYPEARYTIVDIEPALTISRWYLSTLFPTRDIRFVAGLDPSAVDSVANESVDLGVSISSLQEMTVEQVGFYLGLLDRTVRVNGTVFFKQWNEWRNPVDEIVLRFSEYPIPSSWVLQLDESCPVQTRFQQRAWRRAGP